MVLLIFVTSMFTLWLQICFDEIAELYMYGSLMESLSWDPSICYSITKICFCDGNVETKKGEFLIFDVVNYSYWILKSKKCLFRNKNYECLAKFSGNN